ncbi:hypothetical protein PKCEKB_PKCEKB_16365, partial [Dysosmobacter welbionis]
KNCRLLVTVQILIDPVKLLSGCSEVDDLLIGRAGVAEENIGKRRENEHRDQDYDAQENDKKPDQLRQKRFGGLNSRAIDAARGRSSRNVYSGGSRPGRFLARRRLIAHGSLLFFLDFGDFPAPPGVGGIAPFIRMVPRFTPGGVTTPCGTVPAAAAEGVCAFAGALPVPPGLRVPAVPDGEVLLVTECASWPAADAVPAVPGGGAAWLIRELPAVGRGLPAISGKTLAPPGEV